ncbi:nucleoside recognition domain-containing protein [Alicyclobacillus acidoterrestris]|uniref:Spore maturation protein n=1 Tax=Alicyclobacillus acidoterrestris (strain ATCC 49025 / DSM 3922 / CIP 106132 / NCIMB 13137 / GD3B) TaxID=1356854 RepID=T0DH55_ALIAG|nr:nucleoside recognition domain-containing protein [Alicyclobacillus acidoterrestris]EPZ48896.1 nucleoside recognition protein [Alicyclobacillus acidoterrestris ATCC 49025]UNO47434.1 spore maturation protein [Alicyclobacillus acidoterrestris]
MIDFIWLVLFLAGIVTAMFTGNMSKVADAIIHGSERGVTLSIGLISVIALWLGLMNIAEKAGAIAWLSRLLRPIARRLFPSVPVDHPAMGAILANMSANLLGIGNAATPLGLKAMHELQTLNEDKETASDAMCTLLAINTASITLIPTTVIAIRMQYHSHEPTAVVGTTLLASAIGTAFAIVLDRVFRKLSRRRRAA